jgi:hypothetical protein
VRPAAVGGPGGPRQHAADRGQAPRRVRGRRRSGRRVGRQRPALLGWPPGAGPRADRRAQGPARRRSRGGSHGGAVGAVAGDGGVRAWLPAGPGDGQGDRTVRQPGLLVDRVGDLPVPAFGVHRQMPIAAVDPLARVVAAGPCRHGVRAAHRRGVDDRRGSHSSAVHRDRPDPPPEHGRLRSVPGTARDELRDGLQHVLRADREQVVQPRRQPGHDALVEHRPGRQRRREGPGRRRRGHQQPDVAGRDRPDPHREGGGRRGCWPASEHGKPAHGQRVMGCRAGGQGPTS